MKVYTYKAYDKAGARLDGQLEAIDKQAAINQIKALGLLASEVVENKESAASIFSSSKKVSLADLEFLTAELSLLLSSGVRIDKGLDIIKRSKAQPALVKLLSDISSSISKGQSLSEALKAHDDVFDPLYINLVELGEASGNLPEIFAKLAEDLKFRRDLQRKIISSLTYPFVILAVCILCIVFIFNFIVPKLSVLFTDPETLPWYTQALLGLSNWMQEYQVFMAIGIVAGGFSLVHLFKQPNFLKVWQETLLKIPGLANSVLVTERIRFNSALAMMLQAGLPIDKALFLAKGNIKNQVLQREMEIVRSKVKHGHSLSPSLKQTSLFPDFYISLLEVGEESGNLSKVFDEIANRSRQEFESWTEKMTTLIEPLLILFMGGIVGGVVVVMLMSMVAVNDVGF
ncbi:type II secretion system F family protein [Shewanella sp. Scap07]|uniref:type II secretion system F family protein n=1 Tax=Shewanella sp. Scap07 TaxID=2589987 RepID=UPI0015BF23F1|nr:type II secretion system F family protein [Shewanella sp. Scap07]QLE86115.1 type II secretion system F family protein [Shewanella sp. Scap07]